MLLLADALPTTPSSARREDLRGLAERVREVEQRGMSGAKATSGWAAVRLTTDGPAPFALSPGAVHEWFGPIDDDEPTEQPDPAWRGSVLLLASFARRALHERGSSGRLGGWVVWVGAPCWPYAPGLVGEDRRLIARSLLVDPSSHAERVWAVELALRSPAVAAVIADGRGLRMNESRRLQLAAQAGRTLALVARPARELAELSCAATRWLVRRAPTPTAEPRWTVVLLRCKGVQPAAECPRSWALEYCRETLGIRVPADVARRPDETAGLRIATG